jgi:hypothetical protein
MKKTFLAIFLASVTVFATTTRTFNEAVKSTVSVQGGNVKLESNTVSSTNTNGDININPNGTGGVIITDQTATTVPYLDASKKITSSVVTPTELGRLSGIGSAAVGVSDAQVLTNKDINGGTASNTNRITLPTNTKTNLDGLTRKEGTVVYATDDDKLYVDDGATLNEISGSGGGGGAGINILMSPDNYNADAENGNTNDWSESGGGTLASTSTAANVAFGTYAISYDASASTDYVASTAVTVPPGLYGNNCMAEFYYQGFDTNMIASVHNGTSDIATETLFASTNYRLVKINFVCPSSGTVQFRITASANAVIGYVDQLYIGIASNIGSGKPQDIFSAKVSSTDVVSDESLNWINGNCTNASTGVATCTFNTGIFTVAPNCNCTNSTNISCKAVPTSTEVVVTTYNESAGVIAVTDNNFQLSCQKQGVDATYTQTEYTPDVTNWKLDLNITGANVDLGTSDQTAYVAPSDTGLTLTVNTGKGSASAGISCSSTNDNTVGSTTCSAGSEQIGFVANFPKAGLVEACFEYSHRIQTGASGIVFAAFQAVRTANGSQTIAEEGGDKKNSGLGTASTSVAYPITTCGTFQIPSVDKHTIRLMYEQDVTATVTTNTILADASAVIGQRDVKITARYIDQSVTSPVYSGSITSKYSGALRMESAHISITDVVSRETGDWINGNCTNATTGQATCTFNTGIWASAPTCVCTLTDRASGMCTLITDATTSSVLLGSRNGVNTADDGEINLICIGPR